MTAVDEQRQRKSPTAPTTGATPATQPPPPRSASSLSCVVLSKSLASCRSRSWLSGAPKTRLTMRPRFTAGRFATSFVQRWT